ncbi:hypothetical protein [Riemerella anatipestifer]|uniref:hypothetical protein n=1 Tax=Riemerella anatipestifer TaxID=34085 RepID=UPI000309C6E5|nr:hypothetical protein [Riemerella anatipestifer]
MFKTQTTAPVANNSSDVQRNLKEVLTVADLTDYKLRYLKEVLTDELDNFHDTINEEIKDERKRAILFEKSNRVIALFAMLKDLLPQVPDYFEQVNMLLAYDDLRTSKSA